jgi:CheB methylesterase
VSFPMVGIGASAGGLEAFSELLTNLPVNTGMAYLLVQHLDPTHNSFLVEILAKQTRIPIEQAREGIEVSPNHVYVLPPNSTLTLGGNRLHLATRETVEQRRSPVDILFDSLAERGPNAIGVILSGTGSDGAKGVQILKEAGGIIFAQEERFSPLFWNAEKRYPNRMRGFHFVARPDRPGTRPHGTPSLSQAGGGFDERSGRVGSRFTASFGKRGAIQKSFSHLEERVRCGFCPLQTHDYPTATKPADGGPPN